MRIRITINGENSAFQDNPDEIARILEKLASEMRATSRPDTHDIRDIYGNTCGNIVVDRVRAR